MCELTAGRVLFTEDFFSFFQIRHSQERQVEDSGQGERMGLQNTKDKYYRTKASL